MMWLLLVLALGFAANIQPNGYFYSSTNLISFNITGQSCFLYNSSHWFYDGNSSNITLWLPDGVYNLTLDCDGGSDFLDLVVNSSRLLVPVINETTTSMFVVLPTPNTCDVEGVLITAYGYLNQTFSNGTLNSSCGQGNVVIVPSNGTDTLDPEVVNQTRINESLHISQVCGWSGCYVIGGLNIKDSLFARFSYSDDIFGGIILVNVTNSHNISIEEWGSDPYAERIVINSTLFLSSAAYNENITLNSSFLIFRSQITENVTLRAKDSVVFLLFNATNLTLELYNSTAILVDAKYYHITGENYFLLSYSENLSTFAYNNTDKPIVVMGKNLTWNGSILRAYQTHNITLFNVTVDSIAVYNSYLNMDKVNGTGVGPVGFYSILSNGTIGDAIFCGYNDFDVYSINSTYSVSNLSCDLSYGLGCNSSCSAMPGYTGYFIVKVDAPAEMNNTTIYLRYLPEFISPDICSGVAAYKNDFLPTQLLDCTGPSVILFKANLTQGLNTFRIYYGNTSYTLYNITETYSPSTTVLDKMGGREVLLDGTYEITSDLSLDINYHLEVDLIFEDFFYPGNNFTLWIGPDVAFKGYVDQDGKLIIESGVVNTTITSPGPVTLAVEENYTYIALEGQYFGWATWNGSGIPRLELQGKGRVWIKKFGGENNIYFDSRPWVIYNNPPKIPIVVNVTSSGNRTFPFGFKKVDLYRYGVEAPYYSVSGNPTGIWCDDGDCYAGFEADLTPGTHILYLEPSYVPTLIPTKVVRKGWSYSCPNNPNAILGNYLRYVTVRWNESGTVTTFPSNYVGLAIDVLEGFPSEIREILRAPALVPSYMDYGIYSYAYIDETEFLFARNNVPLLHVQHSFPDYELRFYYSGSPEAICFQDAGTKTVPLLSFNQYYRVYYGDHEVTLYNGTTVNITNGTYYVLEGSGIKVVYAERYDCSDCVFENTTLSNANITANSVHLQNVTFYGFIQINSTQATLENVTGYGYSGTIMRGHGQGPGKGIYDYVEMGSGASHGGMGGRSNSTPAGPTYGTFKLPGIGSSGAGDYYSKGGVGGGLIIVNANDVYINNTNISGESSDAGAGSGGGLLVIANTVTVDNVSAVGGDSWWDGNGAGGGGRISVFAPTTYIGAVDVSGGQAIFNFSFGGPGTLYISNSSGNFLVVDNKGKITPNQAYIEDQVNGEVWIINGAYVEQKTSYLNVTNLYVLNHSVLSHALKQPMNITFDNMFIDESSAIDVTYKGAHPDWDILKDDVDLSPTFKTIKSNAYVDYPFSGLVILKGENLTLNGTISADAGIGNILNATRFAFGTGTAGKIFLNISNLTGSGNITANENDACAEDAFGRAFAMGYISIEGPLDSFTGNIFYYPSSTCVTLFSSYQQDMVDNIVGWGGYRYLNNDSLVLVGNGDRAVWFDNYTGTFLTLGHPAVQSTLPYQGSSIIIGNNISLANITIQNATLEVFNFTTLIGENLMVLSDGRIWALGVESRSNYNSTTDIYCGEGPYPACAPISYTYSGYIGPAHGGLGSIYPYDDLEEFYPQAYGDFRWPTEIGSTAACYGYYSGGALLLNFSNIQNYGVISASGDYATSGGSLILIGNISNYGIVESNGGNSRYSCRALGGGGRIAIYYDSFIPGTITAYGGEDLFNYVRSNNIAGAGTIYLHNLNTGESELIIENKYRELAGRNTSTTPLPIMFDSPIHVKNAVVSAWGTHQSYNLLNLSNATLTHPPYPLSLNNYINSTISFFYMDENSSVNASYMGYGPSSDSTGLGPGGATGSYGGGGYGGPGGYYTGGPTYGVLTNPVYLGSSGGPYYSSKGGAGGGLIMLWVEHGIFGNFSYFDASGEAGEGGSYSYAGGGSGGSILLFLKNASGLVYTIAKGGDSGSGGSGGGGRIAIYLAYNNSFDVAYNVSPGDTRYSSRKGGVGTFYMGPYYYLEVVSLPAGPFNISDNVSLQVDLKAWNGSGFESYGLGSVWLYHTEQTSFNLTNGETIPSLLNFSYVGTFYEGNLTWQKAGMKNYTVEGTYGPDFPVLVLPYNAEVYGWYINMTKDQPFYIPNTLAIVDVEVYYYPTMASYAGNISFYYKNTLLQNTFINRSYTLIFNVGNEAGFHELVAHID